MIITVTTRRIEPPDEIPRLSLEESEGNRIKLQRLDIGDERVVVIGEPILLLEATLDAWVFGF